MTQWPYEPEPLEMEEFGPFPNRNCGTYWMAAELSQPIRSIDMLVPGQSGLHRSPHFKDQLDLFWNWNYKDMRFAPEAFPPVPATLAPRVFK